MSISKLGAGEPKPWRVVKRSNQLGVRLATLVGPNGLELKLEAGYTGLGNRTAVPIDERKVAALESLAVAGNSFASLSAQKEKLVEALRDSQHRVRFLIQDYASDIDTAPIEAELIRWDALLAQSCGDVV